MSRRPAFDTMVEEIMHDETDEWMLHECMSLDAERVRKIPIRYRIIALGFIRQYTLDELNEKLKAEGFAQLYSRSVWETSLIYAFKNGLSYQEWKNLQIGRAHV